MAQTPHLRCTQFRALGGQAQEEPAFVRLRAQQKHCWLQTIGGRPEKCPFKQVPFQPPDAQAVGFVKSPGLQAERMNSEVCPEPTRLSPFCTRGHALLLMDALGVDRPALHFGVRTTTFTETVSV